MTGRQAAGYAGAIAAGLAVNVLFLPQMFATGWAVGMKVANRGELCSWGRTLTYFSHADDFERLYERARRELKVTASDEALGLEKRSGFGVRDLWAPRGESARLVAEQEWLPHSNPEDHVQPGDVVIDCGAKTGAFVAKALQRGAAKVVAIEPDPRYVECLRRSFRQEIEYGRVALAPFDAWTDAETTIDTLVRDFKLARVHFIRMDLAGAERLALRGARETLRMDRPRVMLNLHHRVDDGTVLPGILRSVHRDYHASCGPCQRDEAPAATVVPRAVYFR